MAMEEFKWQTQIQHQPAGEFSHRIKKVEFGDGYSQVAANGINPETQSWPFIYLGKKEQVMPIFYFIRRHTFKSFIWMPPFGDKGLYRVKADSISMTPLARQVMKISAIFEESFCA